MAHGSSRMPLILFWENTIDYGKGMGKGFLQFETLDKMQRCLHIEADKDGWRIV